MTNHYDYVNDVSEFISAENLTDELLQHALHGVTSFAAQSYPNIPFLGL